jgi:UPF0755 protein
MLLWARAPKDASGAPRVFEIKSGQGLAAAAGAMERAGLVTHAGRFAWMGRLLGGKAPVHAGYYLLSPAMSPLAIMDAIRHGKYLLQRLTVIEGDTISQIAALVEQAGIGSASDFQKKALDPAEALRLGMGNGLEGYLFPDTYFFPKGTAPEKIIAAMVRRFNSVFSPEWRKRARDLNMTVHQVVTLASIIEKETGNRVEYGLVSSVFHNRLRLSMRLQSDPTVIYGMPCFNGNLTREDLERPTPYNTYTNFGLPPGPIANPGRACLEAALYPSDTQYLYFVSRGNGTHYFSKSLEEHNSAVAEYRKGQGKLRGTADSHK